MIHIGPDNKVRWQKATWEAAEEEEVRRRFEASLESKKVNLAEKTVINDMIKYHIECERGRRRASSAGTIFVTPPPSPILG